MAERTSRVKARSRRTAPAVGRHSVDERRLADVALTLIEQRGLTGLTVRALADALGIAPMSVYGYALNKEAILQMAAQALYSRVERPDDGSPADAARGTAHALRRTLVRHPNAAPLVGRFPPCTPDALAFLEVGFRSCRREGWSAEATARRYRALISYCLGALELETTRYLHPERDGDGVGRMADPHVERLLPHVAEIGGLLRQQDDAEEFDHGLDLLLAGMDRD